VWLSEIAALLYFGSGIGLSIYLPDYFMLVFFVMITAGIGFLLSYRGNAVRQGADRRTTA
jgi:hypothetical protein